MDARVLLKTLELLTGTLLTALLTVTNREGDGGSQRPVTGAKTLISAKSVKSEKEK